VPESPKLPRFLLLGRCKRPTFPLCLSEKTGSGQTLILETRYATIDSLTNKKSKVLPGKIPVDGGTVVSAGWSGRRKAGGK
jgi:hypothetical protein